MQGNITKPSVLYIGTKDDYVEQVFDLIGVDKDFLHISSPIAAFYWLKKQQSAPSLIFVEGDLEQLSAVEYIRTLQEKSGHDQLRIAVLEEQPNAYAIEKYINVQVLEVFSMPLQKIQSKRLTSLLGGQPKGVTKRKQQKTQAFPMRIPLWKRAFDVLLSGTALVLLSPFLLVVTLLIKLDSKGPVFYISKRVGRGYQVFDFYKFRTMKVNADKELLALSKTNNQYNKTETEIITNSCEGCDGQQCTKLVLDDQVVCEKEFLSRSKSENSSFTKIKNDPRITPLGQFLRNTSIDELPQLFNILKGDMSIVGNRPLPLYEAEQLTTDESIARFLGPAGLTGLWQVRKRGQGEMSAAERKSLDNEYSTNYSFWLDMKLIFQTLAVFIQKENV